MWQGGWRRLMGVLLVVGVLVGSTGAVSAQADTTTVVERETIVDGIDIVTCGLATPEIVRLSGRYQRIIHYTRDAAGGFTAVIQTTFVGIKAVGQTTGTRYTGRAVSTQQSTVRADSFPYTSTLNDQVMLLGQGAAGDLVIRSTSHLTFRADGTLTADKITYTPICR